MKKNKPKKVTVKDPKGNVVTTGTMDNGVMTFDSPEIIEVGVTYIISDK